MTKMESYFKLYVIGSTVMGTYALLRGIEYVVTKCVKQAIANAKDESSDTSNKTEEK